MHPVRAAGGGLDSINIKYASSTLLHLLKERLTGVKTSIFLGRSQKRLIDGAHSRKDYFLSNFLRSKIFGGGRHFLDRIFLLAMPGPKNPGTLKCQFVWPNSYDVNNVFIKSATFYIC